MYIFTYIYIHTYIIYIYIYTPEFSGKPPFKVPSNWTPPIPDAELELYISEIEDILIIINESVKSDPNFTKDKHEAVHLFTQDDQSIIKPVDKGATVIV